MNCQFCLTGRMGLIQNLSTAQIVEQVIEARRIVGEEGEGATLTNLVFMGTSPPPLSLNRTQCSIPKNSYCYAKLWCRVYPPKSSDIAGFEWNQGNEFFFHFWILPSWHPPSGIVLRQSATATLCWYSQGAVAKIVREKQRNMPHLSWLSRRPFLS